MKNRWKSLPLLLLLGLGFWLLWNKTGRWFPVDRQWVWQPPSESQRVRELEVQIWREGHLLRREVRRYPSGMTSEFLQEMALPEGTYDVQALWLLDGQTQPQSFKKSVSVSSEKNIVVSMP